MPMSNLQEAMNYLLATADDEGCSGDLIVVSKDALEDLANIVFPSEQATKSPPGWDHV